MLRAVVVQNFKALGPQPIEVELLPLTVFVGENGAGKSSILDALAILGQTIRERHNRSGLVIEGDLTELKGDYSRDARQKLFYRHDCAEWMTLGATVSLTMAPLAERTRFLGTGLSELRDWPPRAIRFSVRTRDFQEIHEWEQDLWLDDLHVGKWASRANPNPRFGPISEAQLAGVEPVRIGTADRILSHDLFGMFDPSKLSDAKQRLVETGRVAVDMFARHFYQNLSFVSSVRGAPLFQTKTGPVLETVGKHGEESLRLLNALSQRGRERVGLFEEWAGQFGMQGLRGVWRGGDELTGAFVDPHSGTEIDSIGYAGSGSKLVVPILLELAKANPGDTVLLDEPEMSLHPAWVLTLANVLVGAVERGVQIIMATQAPTFVLAMARALRAVGRKDLCSIVEVTRDSSGARATPLSFSPKGFLTRWPYSEVEAELLTEVADEKAGQGDREQASRPAERKNRPRRKRSPRHG